MRALLFGLLVACGDEGSPAHDITTCEPPQTIGGATIERCELACSDNPIHSLAPGPCRVRDTADGGRRECDQTFTYEPTGERGCCGLEQPGSDTVVFFSCLYQ